MRIGGGRDKSCGVDGLPGVGIHHQEESGRLQGDGGLCLWYARSGLG
jgi:hypothetical protein